MTALIILTSITIILILISGSVLTISEYAVKSDKLPESFDGFTVLQLSDLHNTSFGKDNETLIKKIDEVKPDIIVMTGDMVSRPDTDFSVFLSLVQKLSEKYPVYYVMGNHEQKMKQRGRLGTLFEELASAGVMMLNDEKLEITRGDSHINLYGACHSLGLYRQPFKSVIGIQPKLTMASDDVSSILGECGEDDYNMLLIHNPLFFEAYREWGADITFSGHIHGGIIRLPLIGGVLSPDRSFFPKYSEGIYEYDGKTLCVSRGTGSRLRLGSFPQIVTVRLEAA